MDRHSLIQRILAQMRGQDVSAAPQAQAPVGQAQPGLSQAYDAPMPGVQNQQMPMMFNQGLDQTTTSQGQNFPMHPVIQKMVQNGALMGFLRNRANDQMQAGNY